VRFTEAPTGGEVTQLEDAPIAAGRTTVQRRVAMGSCSSRLAAEWVFCPRAARAFAHGRPPGAFGPCLGRATMGTTGRLGVRRGVSAPGSCHRVSRASRLFSRVGVTHLRVTTTPTLVSVFAGFAWLGFLPTTNLVATTRLPGSWTAGSVAPVWCFSAETGGRHLVSRRPVP